MEGYGYAVALDTGGAVKGDKIDLFDWVSPSRANTFGIQAAHGLDSPVRSRKGAAMRPLREEKWERKRNGERAHPVG